MKCKQQVYKFKLEDDPLDYYVTEKKRKRVTTFGMTFSDELMPCPGKIVPNGVQEHGEYIIWLACDECGTKVDIDIVDINFLRIFETIEESLEEYA